jgi:hypothetical protein
MNLDELENKLFASARLNPPSERVPYAFEKRIMRLIASHPALDHWALWSRALWRAGAPCGAIMLLLSMWSFVAAPSAPATSDLSQEIEKTLWAAAVEPEQPAD